jgi:hypothetical protein
VKSPLVELEPRGGGGTDFRSVIDVARDGIAVSLFRPDFFPFVKGVRRNQTAPPTHRFTESGLLRALSDIAVIVLTAIDQSLAQYGISSQKAEIL